jgi:hypothetical protein
MNYQYKTGIQNSPPQTDQLLQQMQQIQSPWSYNQNHRDVMDNLLQQRSVDMDRYAQQMQDTYAQQQQQASMQSALAGLEQLANDRQNRQNLSNTRLQNMLGFQSQLLGNLLR